MDVKPHPTSPKRQTTIPPVPKVWSEHTFEQPRRLPWFGLIVLMLILNVAVTAGLIVGWGWLNRNAPHVRWLQWLPQSTSTTVVQRLNPAVDTNLPDRVKASLTSLLATAAGQGADGIYAPSQEVGWAVPLSSDGWSLSLAEAVSDGSRAILPTAGLPLTVDATVTDPASAFVFLKSDQLSVPPVSLGSDQPQIGQAVWVVAGHVQDPTAVARHIVNISGPRWLSSDVQDQTWQLDQSVTAAIGAPVLDSRGQVIGLLGTNNHVWPTSAVSPVISAIVQRGQFSRPSVGLRYLMLDQAISASNVEQRGAIIGADTNSQAIQLKGPADKAGVRSGDIITAIDGQILQSDFRKILSGYRPGQTLTLTISRGEKTLTVKLIVGSLPS